MELNELLDGYLNDGRPYKLVDYSKDGKNAFIQPLYERTILVDNDYYHDEPNLVERTVVTEGAIEIVDVSQLNCEAPVIAKTEQLKQVEEQLQQAKTALEEAEAKATKARSEVVLESHNIYLQYNVLFKIFNIITKTDNKTPEQIIKTLQEQYINLFKYINKGGMDGIKYDEQIAEKVLNIYELNEKEKVLTENIKTINDLLKPYTDHKLFYQDAEGNLRALQPLNV